MASFFFVSSTRNVHFLCIIAHLPTLPYVLSTSFSTHPKPLTWDKKPFQSRRVHFSRHYETFLLFSALWDWFFSEFFLLFLPSIFDILQQNGCSKNPKGSRFYIFRHYATYRKLQKYFEKISENFFPHFLVFWELLLSPVVEKVVFESYWALDTAPTWAVPGLFLLFSLTLFVPLFGTEVNRFSGNLAVAGSSPCFTAKLFRAFAKPDVTEGSFFDFLKQSGFSKNPKGPFDNFRHCEIFQMENFSSWNFW